MHLKRTSCFSALACSLRLCACRAFASILLASRTSLPRLPNLIETDVFTAGAEGYHTYPHPGAGRRRRGGTLLAICEGRKTGRGDHGDVDLVQKRSTDGGKTWGPLELIHEEGGTAKVTIGNPCPVVDQDTGVIWLPFNRDNDRVFMLVVERRRPDLDQAARHHRRRRSAKDWNWYATGPGNGIQLTRGKYKGRLVIPCDHRVGTATKDDKGNWDKAGRSHVIYSDDHGQTWKLGGATDFAMNECAVVELTDGTLHAQQPLAIAARPAAAFRSARTAAQTWEPTTDDPALVESVCQASLIRYCRRGAGVLFSNPAVPTGRHHLTVRSSDDEGKTWPHSRLLCEGSSAYSSLAVLPGGEIGLLYERDDYKHLTFARFPPGSWIRNRPLRSDDRLLTQRRRDAKTQRGQEMKSMRALPIIPSPAFSLRLCALRLCVNSATLRS